MGTRRCKPKCTQGQVRVYYKDIFYYVLIMYIKNILHKIDISSDF